MEMETRVCVFLDLMGFKNRMAQLADDNFREENPGAVRTVAEVLNALQSFGIGGRRGAVNCDGRATQFSDSLVVSFVPAEQSGQADGVPQHWLAFELQHLLMQIVRLGFLCRGGVAIGPLYHVANQVFGQALVDAYWLEKQAIYPHLLVSEKAKRAIVYRVTGETADAANRLFTVGSAGLISMDYIGFGRVPFFLRNTPDEQMYSYYKALRQRLLEMRESNSISVKSKYEWAELRYSEALAKLTGNFGMAEGNVSQQIFAKKMFELKI